MEKVKLVTLNGIGDGRGELSFFESNKEIPFVIKRIYYVYNIPENIKRGIHAHKKLYQAIFCPFGSATFELDNGKEKQTYILDNPRKLLLIEPGVWRDFYINIDNSVVCVAASDFYEENDYIRNYDEFIKKHRKNYWD